MCGITIFNKLNCDINEVNRLNKLRGPDKTNSILVNDITFIHNLLSITGTNNLQPIYDKTFNIVCLFNGEIYNYLDLKKLLLEDLESSDLEPSKEEPSNSDPQHIKNNENIKSLLNNVTSDSHIIIPYYLKYGKSFANYLDGEFSITIFDFRNNEFYLISDPFGTKPLFYDINESDKSFMISSYRDSIITNNFANPKKLPANKVLSFSIKELSLINTEILHKFDFNQYKNNYDDWCLAFSEAVYKRAKDRNDVFVSLSSGYDSGAICCQLNMLNCKYSTFSVFGKEDVKTLFDRKNINNKYVNNALYYNLNENIIKKYKERNEKQCSDFVGYIKGGTHKYSVQVDRASCGVSFISDMAKKANCKINMSGQGADEILSDYGHNGHKKAHHSCFGGLYPNVLNKDFMNKWESFQGGINECLIMKEEIICGSWGIESRYPFLDKKVVQEFLWLNPELKNKNYKAPLHYFMQKNKYPFKPDSKVGFNCLY